MIKTSMELIQEAKTEITEVSVDDLSNKLSAEIVVIDVREPTEFEQAHISQAVNFPRGVLEMKLAQHPLVKESEHPLDALNQHDLYLICRSGARSALAAKTLQNMGFENVFSVAGGMIAWQKQGL